MGPQFHETKYGQRFFDKQLPELTKALNRLAEAKENENSVHAGEKTRPVVEREAFNEALQCLTNSGVEAGEAEDVLMNICFILLGDYRIGNNS